MDLEKTLDRDGVRLVFRNTLRQSMLWRYIDQTWPVEPDALDAEWREHFAYIAAHTVTVEGATLPLVGQGDSKKKIETAYQQFLDAVNQDFVIACLDAINSLHLPIADAIEKPDHALTPEEAADPN